MTTVATAAAALDGRAVVQFLLDQKFRLVMWPAVGDDKGPREPGWQNRTHGVEDWSPDKRVGFFTGTETTPGRFLIDVDIDWAPGSRIAQTLLPATPFVYGRPSKPVSHCGYTTSAPLVSRKYEDPVDRTTIIELRGTKENREIGFQTMAPPSIHSKDGVRESLSFQCFGTPAHIDPPDRLSQAVTHCAIGMLLGKHLGKNGFGHETRLACAGFLLRVGIAAEDLVKMGEAMSVYCNNQEVSDVRRVVESTQKALERGDKKVKGRLALVKLLGQHGTAIVQRILEWLGRAEEANTIIMRGGALSGIVDRCEAALLERGPDIYSRGGALVRPIVLDKPNGDSAVRRDAGSVVLAAVQEPWLLEAIGQVLAWKKQRADGRIVTADPAPIYPRTLLARGEWSFSRLRGVLRAPTLDTNGRIIEVPGFDPASGLLLDFERGAFPSIPAVPTKVEAQEALKKLCHPLRGFPFVPNAAKAAKAVALSAFLTALIRPSLRTAPLHAYDAPAAGTGKSLLAEAVGLLATGCRPPALSQGKSDEEDEKRLSTVLFAGDPVILLDNCERAIQGDFLCSMLTQEVVQARILGQSERRILPSSSLVLATGNNLQFAGDLSRRVVVCRLDAQAERPDERAFDFDFHEELLRNRSTLVVAALTILRAYDVAGRPENLTPMGSFSDWDFVRGALVWLGEADPADTRNAVLADDPMRDELVRIMELWNSAFGSAWIEVGDIDGSTRQELTVLHNALREVCCHGRDWNARSVGKWLGKRVGRIVGGSAFRKDGRKWQLFSADQQRQSEQVQEIPEWGPDECDYMH